MRLFPLLATCAFASGAVATSAIAEQSTFRQHSSHQHGVVEWHIAQEENTLLLEITAPGSDVVGFEHTPRSAMQGKKLKDATVMLKKPRGLFDFNQSANCMLKESDVSHNFVDPERERGHDHGHEDHEDEKHSDHDHDQHGGDHKGGKHSDHDHVKHGEFSARYTFVCDGKSPLESVTTSWFKAFPSTQEITVMAITDSGISAATLQPGSTTFTF